MNAKPSLVAALILTAACIVFFVLASPLVPIADQQVWLWIALATAAASALSWAAAVRGMAERDQESIQP